MVSLSVAEKQVSSLAHADAEVHFSTFVLGLICVVLAAKFCLANAINNQTRVHDHVESVHRRVNPVLAAIGVGDMTTTDGSKLLWHFS